MLTDQKVNIHVDVHRATVSVYFVPRRPYRSRIIVGTIAICSVYGVKFINTIIGKHSVRQSDWQRQHSGAVHGMLAIVTRLSGPKTRGDLVS